MILRPTQMRMPPITSNQNPDVIISASGARPEPWNIHIVDPFDYFDELLRRELLALNVRSAGTIQRARATVLLPALEPLMAGLAEMSMEAPSWMKV